MREPTVIEARSEDEFYGNFILIYQHTDVGIDEVIRRFWLLLEEYPPKVNETVKQLDYLEAKRNFLMKSIAMAEWEEKAESLFARFESSKYGAKYSYTKLKKNYYELAVNVESISILEDRHGDLTALLKTSKGYVWFTWADVA